jgi:hypothetical protein
VRGLEIRLSGRHQIYFVPHRGLGSRLFEPPPHRGQVKKTKENRNIGYVLRNVNIKRSIVVELYPLFASELFVSILFIVLYF